jgi:hypothetical protein
LSAARASLGDMIIFERWESDQDVEAFRVSGSGDGEAVTGTEQIPEIRRAEVHKYRISAVEAP